LQLTGDDVFYALEHVGGCVVMISVGLASVILAQTMPIKWAAPAAGFIYFLIGPLQWYRSVWMNKRRLSFTHA
jgi:hypothetical protein